MSDAATLIRDSRRQAGLTQVALAHDLGLTQPAIAKLEREGSNPTVATLGRVLDATGHELELRASAPPSSVDETLIASRLRMTPARRLAAFESSHRSLARLAALARENDPKA